MTGSPVTKESLVEMTMSNSAATERRFSTRRALSLILLGVALTVGVASPAAAAPAPALDVTVFHFPTHLTPGEDGLYQLILENAGEAPTDAGEPITVTAELPPGVTATEAGDAVGGLIWECSISPDGRTVTCEQGSLFDLVSPIPAGQELCEELGADCRIRVSVGVAPDASGEGTASASVCGGGAPSCGSYTDPTVISSTPAGFGMHRLDGAIFNRDLSPARQAGSHPHAQSTRIEFNTARDFQGGIVSAGGNVKNVRVDLPPGLVVDPSATPTRCSREAFRNLGAEDEACPRSSQVGVAHVRFPGGVAHRQESISAVYNVEAAAGTPAQFGFDVIGVKVLVNGGVRTGDDYGLTAEVRNIPQTVNAFESTVTLWGQPNDPVHDPRRGGCLTTEDPTDSCPLPPAEPSKPLLTNPTSCSADPLSTRAQAESWANPGTFVSGSFDHDVGGVPMAFTGCDALPFDPSISVRPANPRPNAPSGYEVELQVPQSASPDGLATAHLKKAVVVLPEGVSVNPASAHGLDACSSAQIALSNAAAPSCPDASKIGTLDVHTPLLEEPMTGEVYVARQTDNPFGSLLAIYLVARGPGVVVKLAGHVEADPLTGQLTTTFDNNPQLPFSSFRVRFKGGPTAPLVNPPTCGEKTVTTALTPWSGNSASHPSDKFTIDCPGVTGFAPSFAAGTVSPTGGRFSPFAARIDRADGDQVLSGVSVELPPGLAAKLRDVPLCPDAVASDGTPGACPAASRIGSTTVGAGAGANPFFLKGDVYLTGPYKGAPYGLSVQVHAKAGPYDLGMVKVRQALHVDPVDAHVTVVSDPLPTILKGIPLRLRSVNVDVDRPGFTLNPTSCAEKRIAATLTSVAGAVHETGSRFQAGDCASLAFKPRMALRLTGRKQRRTGGHPGLRVSLRQGAGQANIESARVKLPRSLALDPSNANGLCPYEQGLKVRGGAVGCPRSSIIGRATASTPLLNRPLSGPVYFVESKRRTKQGNLVRTLPSLLVALRGEVALDLRAQSSVRGGRLISTFPTVPDAPVSRFQLSLRGGNGGILTVTRSAARRFDICSGIHAALVELDGQNGRRADFRVRTKAPCNAKRR